ncbi:hypothetical protein [Soonwooa purpurea]
MATLFTYGLSQINFNGTKVGMTYKDTCKLTQDAPDVTEHFEEGVSSPAIKNKENKIPKLEFSIMNPDAQFLKTHLGGDYDAASKTFGYDGTSVVANGEWEILPKKGFESITIAKGDADVSIDFEISDKGLLLVKFVVTPLTPDDPDVMPITFKESA